MIGGPIMGGVARLRWDPTKVEVIADGNSFFANGSGYIPKIAALPPLNGQFTIVNCGIGGQTFRKMNGLDGGSSADVDAAILAAHQAGKVIVLTVCEATNSIFDSTNGRTAPQTIQDATDYCTARRAYADSVGGKIFIVMCTTIPREISNSDSIVAIYNQRLIDFNTALKSDPRSMGVDAVVDVRAGTRFDFVATTRAAFDAVADIMPESIAVHPNSAGYDILAPLWGPAMSRLPAR